MASLLTGAVRCHALQNTLSRRIWNVRHLGEQRAASPSVPSVTFSSEPFVNVLTVGQVRVRTWLALPFKNARADLVPLPSGFHGRFCETA